MQYRLQILHERGRSYILPANLTISHNYPLSKRQKRITIRSHSLPPPFIPLTRHLCRWLFVTAADAAAPPPSLPLHRCRCRFAVVAAALPLLLPLCRRRCRSAAVATAPSLPMPLRPFICCPGTVVVAVAPPPLLPLRFFYQFLVYYLSSPYHDYLSSQQLG